MATTEAGQRPASPDAPADAPADISVVIACLNGAATLPEALASLVVDYA